MRVRTQVRRGSKILLGSSRRRPLRDIHHIFASNHFGIDNFYILKPNHKRNDFELHSNVFRRPLRSTRLQCQRWRLRRRKLWRRGTRARICCPQLRRPKLRCCIIFSSSCTNRGLRRVSIRTIRTIWWCIGELPGTILSGFRKRVGVNWLLDFGILVFAPASFVEIPDAFLRSRNFT